MISNIRLCISFCNYFFAGYVVIYATYMMIGNLYGSVKMYQNRRMEQLHNVLDHEFYYPVSIMVPVYNEGMTAVQTVRNLLKLDYKTYEIVVIDDGSEDDTKQLLINIFSLKQEMERPIRYAVACKTINEVYKGSSQGVLITLCSKDNGGCKADACNAGLNLASYPYIVNIDGDEILQKDALIYASRAILEDENVIGVGGNLKISNDVKFKDAVPVESRLGNNPIVNMQVLEYGRSFLGSKILQNTLNMNLIISGGYGLFDKSALIVVGGYDVNSMGEDMELTMKIHQHFRKNKINYKMKYVPDSICFTQAPASMKDLRRQRERWYCGLMQTLLKYRFMVFNPKYGLIGMFMLPYVILYELLSPFITLLGLFIILFCLWDKTLNTPYFLYLYLLYALYGILITMVSYLDNIYMKSDSITITDIVKSFFTVLLDTFFFRLYLSIVELFAFVKIKKVASKWVSPDRVKVHSSDVKNNDI